MGRCDICSFKPGAYYVVEHTHFSGYHRAPRAGLYSCQTCKSQHDADMTEFQGGRRKVIVSDSLLHKYWEKDGYKGNSIHVDITTIPGANIQSGMRGWQATYKDDTVAQDIVILLGTNNIKVGHSATWICEMYEEFQDVVRHHNRDSTIAFCTIPKVVLFFISIEIHRKAIVYRPQDSAGFPITTSI